MICGCVGCAGVGCCCVIVAVLRVASVGSRAVGLQLHFRLGLIASVNSCCCFGVFNSSCRFDSEMCFVSFVHVLVYVSWLPLFLSLSWVFVWVPVRGVIVVKLAAVVSLPFAFFSGLCCGPFLLQSPRVVRRSLFGGLGVCNCYV